MMQQFSRVLSLKTIDQQIQQYILCVQQIGRSVEHAETIQLLTKLKREKVMVGPYPGVSLFEAANRIMTDLVILYGVRWLLENEVFPFDAYTVEFGHDDKNEFDVRAEGGGRTLVGEAFNVSNKFFQSKKRAMLKKIRKNTSADFCVIILNSDAVNGTYGPKLELGEHYVIVDVAKGTARLVPQKASLIRRPDTCLAHPA